MDYAIKYWEEKETNPIEFLNHFRCTTEPIGGGTEHDDDGELVDYDAAVTAIAIAKKDIINKACNWIKEHVMIPYEGKFDGNQPILTDYITWCKDRNRESNIIVNEFIKALEE